MLNLKQELYSMTDKLNACGIAYAICGGFAVAIHGYPRATRNIDLLIAEDQLAVARRELRECGYDLEAGVISFETGRPTARRVFGVSKADGNDMLTIELMRALAGSQRIDGDATSQLQGKSSPP